MTAKNNMTLIKEKICTSLLLFCILLVPGSTFDHDRNVPQFDIPLPNLTVKQGSDAAFTCIVKHLGKYEVAWLRSEDKMILAFHTHMVTQSDRFRVTHNGHNTWILHIKKVQQSDSGTYLCQLNTDPQIRQSGKLEVVVPADIIDEETSSDVVVNEGGSTSLRCKARGYPAPKVKWKRQDGKTLPIKKEFLNNPSEKVYVWEGENLPLRNLQRRDNGEYFCIANNSVPPLVSKRIRVYVHFSPSIKSNEQLVAAPVNFNITLECYVESVPNPVCSWFRNGQMILDSERKMWLNVQPINDFSFKMQLTITNLVKEDFTDYKCQVGNPLGSAQAVVKVKEIRLPPTPKTTTTTTFPYSLNNIRYNSAGKLDGDYEREIHHSYQNGGHRKKSHRGQQSGHNHRDSNHNPLSSDSSGNLRKSNDRNKNRSHSSGNKRDQFSLMSSSDSNDFNSRTTISHNRGSTPLRSALFQFCSSLPLFPIIVYLLSCFRLVSI